MKTKFTITADIPEGYEPTGEQYVNTFSNPLQLRVILRKIKPKVINWDDVADGVLVTQPEIISDLRLNQKIRYIYTSLRFSDKWQVWRGGECPLPAGVMVEVEYRSGRIGIEKATEFNWHVYAGPHKSDIISFRVTGLADGYSYKDEAGS